MSCVCCVGLGMESGDPTNDWTHTWHPWVRATVQALFQPQGTSDEHSNIPDPKTSSTPTTGSLPPHAGPRHAPVTVSATHAPAPSTSTPVTTLKTAVPTRPEPEKFHPTWVFEKYTPIDTKMIDILWKMHIDTRYDIAALDKAWDILKVQAEQNEQHAKRDLQMLDQIRHAFEEHQMQHFNSLHIKRLQSNLATKVQEKNALEAQIKPGITNTRINWPIQTQIKSKAKEITDLTTKIDKLSHFTNTYKDSKHIPERPKLTKCKLLGLFVSPTLQRQY